MHSLKRCTALLLLSFAAVPVFANANLITVSTHVSSSTATQGGANQGEVVINNNHTAEVRTKMNVRVVYADGTVQRLTGLSDPVLPPGGGFVQSVYFVIPVDAALGNATFIAEVSASAPGGLQETETSSASFMVVAP